MVWSMVKSPPHKFGDVSWKGGKKVGELGVVLCNGRVADSKLGFYLTEPHSRVGLVEGRQFECYGVGLCHLDLFLDRA